MTGKMNIKTLLLIKFLILLTFSKVIANDSTKSEFPQIINGKGLWSFFAKLSKKDSEKINIVHWGDSHIQMGYFAERFRQGIDSLYGINGFGSTFPYRIAKYNPFHSFCQIKYGNWKGGNILRNDGKHVSGISGFWANTTDSIAQIEFGPKIQSEKIREFNKITILYHTDENTSFIFGGINSRLDTNYLYFPESIETKIIEYNSIKYYKSILFFNEKVDRINIDINSNSSFKGFTIYGAIFEENKNFGVVYNNCAVGGAQFINLIENGTLGISQSKEINTDLFILSFGSNESYTPAYDENIYRQTVNEFIQRIKREIPNASILLTGPPDTRSKNRYPINTASICRVLREIAETDGYAYFDIRENMGGDGSVIRWLNKGLASHDKLHFTRAGYILQADWLIKALDEQYKSYIKVVNNE